MLLSLLLLACTPEPEPAAPTALPAAAPSAASAPHTARLQVSELGPTGLGPIPGARLRLYDSAALDVLIGEGSTDAEGFALVPSAKTEGVWVLHARAEGHRDTWYWHGDPAPDGDFQWESAPMISDADWGLVGLSASDDAGLGVIGVQSKAVATPGQGLRVQTEPPAARVLYLVDGSTVDPELTESPVGQAAVLVAPGRVRVMATVGGGRGSKEVVAHAGALTAVEVWPEETPPTPP